jgi:hypothetical protein
MDGRQFRWRNFAQGFSRPLAQVSVRVPQGGLERGHGWTRRLAHFLERICRSLADITFRRRQSFDAERHDLVGLAGSFPEPS